MALSDEVKAARKAARQAARERERKRLVESAAETARLAEEAEHSQRFNKRSTREAVAESATERALTIEEYRIAEARGLVGQVSNPEPRNPFDEVAATESFGVPLTTRSERNALTFGHKSDDYIEPDSYVPADAREREERAREAAWLSRWNEDDDGDYTLVADDLDEVDDLTAEDMGEYGYESREWFWFPDYPDRYARRADTVPELRHGQDPESERE